MFFSLYKEIKLQADRLEGTASLLSLDYGEKYDGRVIKREKRNADVSHQ